MTSNKPNTPLHFAVQNGNVEIVKTLLDAGHSPNAENDEGLTPLHIAAKIGNAEIMTLLIDASKTWNNSSVPLQPPDRVVDAPTITGETLNRYFVLWVSFLVASIISIFNATGDIGYACNLLLILGTIIFQTLLLYQCWKLIPTDIARTTPNEAIGLCFIPFYNWYWVFVTFKGLAKDMNKTLQSRGIQFRIDDVSVGSNVCLVNLILWYILYPCIVMGFVPVLRDAHNIFFHLVIIVGMLCLPQFVFFTSITNGAIALLYSGRSPTKKGDTDDSRIGQATPQSLTIPVTKEALSQSVSVSDVSTSQNNTIKKLNFYYTSLWICIACVIPTFGLAVIPAVIFACMLHNQLWKLIPADIARTTPGKAVGFCFIPLFNCYWVFVSCLGLCKDMNKTLQQHRIQHQVSEVWSLIYCILYAILVFYLFASWLSSEPVGMESIMLLIPLMVFAGILFFVPSLIILIFIYKAVKNVAIALLKDCEGDRDALARQLSL